MLERGLDYSIFAAVVGGFACLQCMELITITACFPLSLACFIVLLVRIMMVESFVQLVDFLGLRRHHVNYLLHCVQRFLRHGPLQVLFRMAKGWPY